MSKDAKFKRFLTEDILPYIFNRQKKPLFRQIRESWLLYQEYNYVPYHYFKSSLFTNHSPVDISPYIPPKIIEWSFYDLNHLGSSPEIAMTVADKATFERIMAENGINCVGTVAIIDKEGNMIDRDGKAIDISILKDAARPFGGKLFAKPRKGSGGKGTLVLDADGAELFKLSDYIIQPLVKQHPDIDSIFAGSVNTIRIDTLKLNEHCVHNAAVIRIGTGRSFVDNWDLGSIAVGIDLDTGRLKRTGRRKNKFGDQQGFEVHPDTGVRFENRQIPYWNATRHLACAAAAAVWPLRSVGWDIAITGDGPVLIEGNVLWDVSLMQTAWGGLRDTPIGQYALNWYQDLNSR